ncbi:MAG: Gfo/Idh/MocA family oxidoreductase [Pirellulaceae bacterium]|nr:Gfo/Idh/MocA family oxidoreductase [Pirellulaceae bacterium]
MSRDYQHTMLETMWEAMRSAIATERAGTPVSARVYLECASDAEQLDHELATAADMLGQLFGNQVETLAVFGSRASRQLSSLLRFSGGQSALVSVVAMPSSGHAEFVVFAERGTLRWQGPDDSLQPSCQRPPSPLSSQTFVALLARIRDELADPRPVLEGRPFPATAKPTPCAPPYGILLVSGDHTHQPGYAEALAADPRCHLIAVTDEVDIPDRRRRKNEQLAQRLDVPYLDDLDSALARDDIQIVSVCAEPYRRGRIIVKAAYAGKHLYLDKPLCGTQVEADAIVTAVRDAGVVAHMFSQVCFDSARKARARVSSGQLGDLVAIHTDLCFAKGHSGTAKLDKPRHEAAQPDRYELVDSKRELTNVGIYNVVLLLWLTQRNVRRVVASTGNYFFSEHQSNDMEDFGQVLLEFDGGVTATLSAGRLGWKSHPSSGLNRIYLVGSQDSAIVDAHQPRVEMWTAGECWAPPQRDPEDPMGMWQAPPSSPFRAKPKLDWIVPGSTSWKLDTSYFLDCVEKGRASEVPVELAAAATEVLLAAYRSAATGRPVQLPLITRGAH